jgi:hypothetical protein
MPLLSLSQLSSIQKIALLGMTTPITILRRIVDFGMDMDDNPYGSSLEYTNVTPSDGVLGMLHSTPTPEARIDDGQLITVNTYRLWVPVGTDIKPGDHIVIAMNTYVVSDTTVDETWPAFLSCSLRLKE